MNTTLLKGQVNALLSIFEKISGEKAVAKKDAGLFDDDFELDADFQVKKKPLQKKSPSQGKSPSQEVNPKVKEAIVAMARYIIGNEDACAKILEYLDGTDFYKAPASTKFHGNVPGGLASHTLCVIKQALAFSPLFAENWMNSGAYKSEYDFCAEDVFVAALSHDFCKINIYETTFRNVKDASGRWTQVPYYVTRGDNRALGHGGESCLKLLELWPQYIEKRRVIEAIKAHMGFSDLSSMESCNYANLLDNPLVLLLQFADQTAVSWMKDKPF